MKYFNLSLVASALCLFTTISGSTSARADDFPQTIAAAQRSVTRGFNQASLTVLHRAAAADAATVGVALTAKLCPAPCSSKSAPDHRNALQIAGDHWSLKIEADGSSAEFQDHNVQARAHSLGKDPSQKMSDAALERAGRAFIAANLSSVIGLGPEEDLVPVRTAYREERSQNLLSGETKTAVVANRVVFGRTLHGIPVVGGGSRVVITFTNDGALESFRYDWPKYETEKDQDVVGAREILQRVQTVVSARAGVSAPASAAVVPSGEGEAYPVVLTPDASLQALECGYFDPGVAARQAGAPVQPGCVYHAVSQGSNGTRQGFAGAVPAGTKFAADAGWMETQILGSGRN